MNKGFSNESLLDIYLYETAQNIEQLEQLILDSEAAGSFSPDALNEIFRLMHTIKGSSGMMAYGGITALAHAVEDLFDFLRENRPQRLDCAGLSDLVLSSVDFIKLELDTVRGGGEPAGDPAGHIRAIRSFLSGLQQQAGAGAPCAPKAVAAGTRAPAALGQNPLPGQAQYEAAIWFTQGCGMENLRAFAIVHHLKELADHIRHVPQDLEGNDSARLIQEQGFTVTFSSAKEPRQLQDYFMNTAFVRDLALTQAAAQGAAQGAPGPAADSAPANGIPAQALCGQEPARTAHQSFISVDVTKLDKLMDLMGELVIAEAMVTHNPELEGLELNRFHKAARQLRKITGEMQDMVMAIRMVPLSATFHKMHRIVRDMGRQLSKEVTLTLAGEGTEVDKNIIEHISDPLMHLIRNAVDHGIEPPQERQAAGKPPMGQVLLTAQNAGSDILVTVRDDGRGLDREKILSKAQRLGLLAKPPADMTDREVYGLLFVPGFSTSEGVTEFSGRGVGLDVVVKNLEAVGGSASIDSANGKGTVTTLRIPLTLAIIDGMNIRVGNSLYTVPIASLRETLRARRKDIVKDPQGNEMLLLRGACYPVLRLHRVFAVASEVTDLTQGILLVVEQEGGRLCLFADEILGQQAVVVKALPAYMRHIRKMEGLSGCTLLPDGSISLILNVGGLSNL